MTSTSTSTSAPSTTFTASSSTQPTTAAAATPRIILITGATRGLGLGLARAYSRQQNTVVLGTARDPDAPAADALRALPNTKVLRYDAEDLDEAARLERRVQRACADIGVDREGVERREGEGKISGGSPVGWVDEVWNNAGVLRVIAHPDEISPSAFLEELKVNTVAPTAVTAALLPLLRKSAHGGRKVVFLGSVNGSCAAMEEALRLGWPGPDPAVNGVYCTTKAAVGMIAVHWANALRKEGIAVTPIHPGWVKTDMGSPAAQITVEESVVGMMRVVADLKPEDRVVLRAYNGAVIPW